MFNIDFCIKFLFFKYCSDMFHPQLLPIFRGLISMTSIIKIVIKIMVLTTLKSVKYNKNH